MPEPGCPAERVVFGLGAFDLSLGDYLNGIPTNVTTSANNIIVDLPTDSADPQIQQLVALGVTSVDAGFKLDAAWNQETNAIDVKEISVNGADLASVVLNGTIGNATEALFRHQSRLVADGRPWASWSRTSTSTSPMPASPTSS